MDIKEFEEKLLLELKNNNKECINTIENNEKLIQFSYNESQENAKALVERINEIILTNDIHDFSLIENVLKHKLFEKVLSEFRESNILIKACQDGNKKVLKWLLTMDINRYTQDENGMTSLMYAAENKELLFVIDALVSNDDDNIHLTDKNGENALFHSLCNYDAFEKLLRTRIDVNHQNKEGDTVFISCCKNEVIGPYHKIVKLLVPRHKINLNIKNNEGKTGLTYLIKNGRYQSISHIKGYLNVDTNENENSKEKIINETSLYDLIPVIDSIYDNTDDAGELAKKLVDYPKTLIELTDFEFNLNKEVDSVGNTLIMYFMMKEDYCAIEYLIKNSKIDLSIQNQLGISATFLSLFLSEKIKISVQYNGSGSSIKYFDIENVRKHKSFDHSYIDPKGNNLLIHYIVRDEYKGYLNTLSILSKNEDIIDYQNDQNETALIVAAKLGRSKYITNIFLERCNINHQDHLGNTALFYAVKLKDIFTINLLAYNHADASIKNKQGVSAMDLAIEMNDENILDVLKNPIKKHEMEKKIKKSSSENGIFSFMKKKNTDEKLEEYIQNYQIKNYQNEYNDLLINNYITYKPLSSYLKTELPLKISTAYNSVKNN